jgi:hypothetical protein
MRDNIKTGVLVLALVIAGVSLPTSIISMTRKPTPPITEVNNHYYYYYYNNTVIERYNNTIIVWVNNTVVLNQTIVEEDNPIIDRSKKMEEHYFRINTTHPFYILGNYTMGPNELYFYDALYYSARAQQTPNVYVIQDIWFDIWNETDYEVGNFYNPGNDEFVWNPPFLANWLIIQVVNDAYLPNNWDWLVYDSIVTTQA